MGPLLPWAVVAAGAGEIWIARRTLCHQPLDALSQTIALGGSDQEEASRTRMTSQQE
mgnify:CR=1 FL=1